jgi:hypothetical protein
MSFHGGAPFNKHVTNIFVDKFYSNHLKKMEICIPTYPFSRRKNKNIFIESVACDGPSFMADDCRSVFDHGFDILGRKFIAKM